MNERQTWGEVGDQIGDVGDKWWHHG